MSKKVPSLFKPHPPRKSKPGPMRKEEKSGLMVNMNLLGIGPKSVKQPPMKKERKGAGRGR